MKLRSVALSLTLAACIAAAASAQTPLTTEFTYQGQVKQSGTALNGTADFQFKLFGVASGGTQVGSTQSVNSVTVTNGLFTVALNFGTTAFSGDARWLEIAVRSPAGGGAFTTLTPRQPLSAAPYAMYALSGPGSGGPWVVSGNNIFNTNTGNVGIGTTSPQSRFHVHGQSAWLTGGNGGGLPPAAGAGLRLYNDGNRGEIFAWNYSTNSSQNLILQETGGNVGIGAITPQANLHVVTAGEGIRIQGPSSGVDNGAYLSFANSTGTPLGYVGDGSSGDDNLYLTSYFADVTLFTPAGRVLTAKSGGNVGVGTTDPIGGLHVKAEPFTYGGTLTLEGDTHSYVAFFPDGAAAGRKGFFGFASPTSNDISVFNETPGGDINLFTSGGGATQVTVLEITGADLAEKFPTSEKVDPGMVVAIDAKNPGKLCMARGAYNRCVAGIVSGANDFSAGAVLGNLPGQEDAPAVALSGRVYVWCDATSGAIQPGDLLTTADQPGHAMRVTDFTRGQGAIIGKAMTALDSGRALVLVLVNLQ